MSDAAAVAEDYRHALDDLQSNVRVEIVTLTNIAKESISYAHAISDVLQNHIKEAPAQRTLPGLYVLDSIVKNIGTPYTLYFGPNLYGIFMKAYAKVDHQTRRKMDEMLKTWKEPVPGSLDTRPVFPPGVTRPIENALLGARTRALAAQQKEFGAPGGLGRARAPMPPARDTPTPPNSRPGQGPGPFQQPGQAHHGGANGQQSFAARPNNVRLPMTSWTPPEWTDALQTRIPPRPASLPPPQALRPAPGAGGRHGAPQLAIDVEELRREVHHLVEASKKEFAQKPQDTSVVAKLKALLELQTVLERQDMAQRDLVLIKKLTSDLSVNQLGATNAHAAPTLPPQQMPRMAAAPASLSAAEIAQLVSRAAVVPTSPPASSIDSLLGPGALTKLVAGLAARKPAAPPMVPARLAAADPAPPTPQRASVDPTGTSMPVQNPMALLQLLKQRGLLPNAPPPAHLSVATTTTTPTGRPLAAGIDLAALLSTVQAARVGGACGGVALKRFDPVRVGELYQDLGTPCTQCGRRFRHDEEGRRKKTAHMDWHFRVHQRMGEAEKRGLHRAWYVGAKEWVASREAVDFGSATQPILGGDRHDTTGDEAGGHMSGLCFIRAPDPGDMGTNRACPICQEEFESKYMNGGGVDDWVWKDATTVEGRVFHATCLAAATQGAAHSRATPEPGVLGKRKTEHDYPPMRRSKLHMHGS